MVQKKTKRGRPLKGAARRQRVSFTLPPTLVEWLDRAARRRGVTKSELMELALEAAKRESSRFPIDIPTRDIERFCRHRSVRSLSAFGSILGDTFTGDSDIDLLIEFDPEDQPSLFEIINMEESLSALLGGRKVDLKTPSELSKYFRDSVLGEAELIYER